MQDLTSVLYLRALECPYLSSHRTLTFLILGLILVLALWPRWASWQLSDSECRHVQCIKLSMSPWSRPNEIKRLFTTSATWLICSTDLHLPVCPTSAQVHPIVQLTLNKTLPVVVTFIECTAATYSIIFLVLLLSHIHTLHQYTVVV